MTHWEALTDFENDYEVETEPPHRIRRKCDGFMLNVRAPLNMEIPVGYSAKCLIECLPYTGVSRDRARVSFTPHEIVKFKVGEKVVKRNLLDDFLSPSPAPSLPGVGASSSLKK